MPEGPRVRFVDGAAHGSRVRPVGADEEQREPGIGAAAKDLSSGGGRQTGASPSIAAPSGKPVTIRVPSVAAIQIRELATNAIWAPSGDDAIPSTAGTGSLVS